MNRMEFGVPTWNAGERSYSFHITKSPHTLKNLQYYEASQGNADLPADTSVTADIVNEFLAKTKKYFTNPLTQEKVLKHLRHTLASCEYPSNSGWYSFEWKPVDFVVKTGDFSIVWKVSDIKEGEPMIPAEFTSSTTPRVQSPAPDQPTMRSIQIHDTLIPVGDLPLSDLPPLAFGTEEIDPEREETKRRIREARLKVQLAKLKAQRMEQKYYERYGATAEESEESSEFSSESEEDELPFGNHSH